MLIVRWRIGDKNDFVRSLFVSEARLDDLGRWEVDARKTCRKLTRNFPQRAGPSCAPPDGDIAPL